MNIAVYGGRLITRDGIVEGGGFIAEAGRISALFRGVAPALPKNYERIDADGDYISPGFIDAHVHGGGGADVMDGEAEAVLHIAQLHLGHGMTSIVPTTLTQGPDTIRRACTAVRQAMNIKGRRQGARILGIHMEGPFLSKRYRGAQNPDYLLEPSVENYLRIGGGEDVIRLSMAPELPGAMALADYLENRGVLLSVAHSDADYPIMLEALHHGFRHVTHMYNGMSVLASPDYYGRAGVALSALELAGYALEVISDGRHIPPELIRLLRLCKRDEQLMLTSDATRPTGMPEGEYMLGGLPVLVEDGVAMLRDRSSFAGSVATADRLLRNAVQSVGIPLDRAVHMLSHNVAKSVGLDHQIGALEVGKRADFVVFDKDISIRLVGQSGQITIDHR